MFKASFSTRWVRTGTVSSGVAKSTTLAMSCFNRRPGWISSCHSGYKLIQQ